MTTLGVKNKIYIDMDGVLARWQEGCSKEDTLKEGYFYSLELEPAVKEAILMLEESGFDINILSAAYTQGPAREEKKAWLEKHGLGHIKRLFVDCGVNKANYIEKEEGVSHILLDDYNFNLNEWENTGVNFVAVKFLNGINGGSNNWDKYSIYHYSSGETIAHSLANFAIFA